MRRVTLFACMLLSVVMLSAQEVNLGLLTAKIVDESSTPIGYTTATLTSQSDTTAVYGAISDIDGLVEIKAPKGEYNLEISFMGYLTIRQEATITTSKQDLGTFTLEPDNLVVDDVVIKAERITQKADGFIVNMKDSPLGKGKSGYDMLRYAPGVMTSDGIKINGRGGTILYVNNRLMNMSSDEIENYLNSLSGEDIERIEVTPIAGAEYDATATGGVIHLTLRQQRTSGYYGSINTSQSVGEKSYLKSSNSANISYRKGKLSLFSNLSFNYYKYRSHLDEETEYLTEDISNITAGWINNWNKSTSAEVSGVYDITEKQSIGARILYGYSDNSAITDGINERSVDNSYYLYNTSNDKDEWGSNIIATLDYNLKLDTLGSTFKASADLKFNDDVDNSIYLSDLADLSAGALGTGFTNDISTKGNMYSFNGDFNIYLSEKSSLKTGVKLFAMNITNGIDYNNRSGDIWEYDDEQSDLFSYDERVAAAYVGYSYGSGRWSLSAGLRGEYTWLDIDSEIEENRLSDNYFNLFPNVSLLYSINPEKGHSITLNGNQKFARPYYGNMRPFILATSDYSYIMGNPSLVPEIKSNVTLTQTLFHKYSLSLSYTYDKDPIQQLTFSKADEPGVLYYQHQNTESVESYSINIFAPIAITKWFDLMVNLQGKKEEQRYQNSLGEIVSTNNFTYVVYGAPTFKLGEKSTIGADFYYTSPIYMANFIVSNQYNLNVNFSTPLLKDKLTLTLFGKNILRSSADITTTDPLYLNVACQETFSRNFGLSLRYNFSSGKKQEVKKATSSSEYLDRL